MLNINLLKSLIAEKGLNQKEFIEENSLSVNSFYRLLRTGSARESTIKKIAAALNVSPDKLYSRDQSKYNVIHVPISVQAGYFMGYTQDSPEIRSFWLPEIGDTQHYAFNVSGDSMAPTLMNGDIVICQKLAGAEEIKPGAVYVLFDKTDGVVVKRLQLEGQQVKVVSDNPKYPAYSITARSVTQLYRVKRVITANI
jgi:SOS-response transcriptional repressor LexA